MSSTSAIVPRDNIIDSPSHPTMCRCRTPNNYVAPDSTAPSLRYCNYPVCSNSNRYLAPVYQRVDESLIVPRWETPKRRQPYEYSISLASVRTSLLSKKSPHWQPVLWTIPSSDLVEAYVHPSAFQVPVSWEDLEVETPRFPLSPLPSDDDLPSLEDDLPDDDSVPDPPAPPAFSSRPSFSVPPQALRRLLLTEILRRWSNPDPAPQARLENEKVRRQRQLSDRVTSVPRREFGVLYDFKSKDTSLLQLLEAYLDWILKIHHSVFDKTILEWLEESHHLWAFELIVMHSKHPRISRANALRLGLPHDAFELQFDGSTVFTILLFIASFFGGAVYNSDNLLRVRQAVNIFNKVGGAAQTVKSAFSGLPNVLDHIMSFVVRIKDFVVDCFTTIFGKAKQLLDFVKVMVLWVVEKMTSGYNVLLATQIFTTAQELLGPVSPPPPREIPESLSVRARKYAENVALNVKSYFAAPSVPKTNSEAVDAALAKTASPPQPVNAPALSRRPDEPPVLLETPPGSPRVARPPPSSAPIPIPPKRYPDAEYLYPATPPPSAEVFPEKQSGWLSTAISIVFGCPVDKFSLPAFRSGATALTWLLQSGFGLFSYLAAWVTGIPYPSTTFEVEVVTKHEEISAAHTRLTQTTIPQIRRDLVLQSHAQSLIAWHKELYAKKSFLLSRLNAGWSSILTSITRNVEEMKTRLSTAAGAGAIRPVPVWFNFWGERGIGKSWWLDKTFLPSLWAELLRRGLVLGDWDPTSCAFSKRPTEHFWDGYGNQPFHLMDDFLQSTAAETRALQAEEMIAIGSPAPLNLKVAQVENKNQVRYSSIFVGSSSNKQLVDSDAINSGSKDLGLEEPKALTSRITCEFLVTEDEKYPGKLRFTPAQKYHKVKRLDERGTYQLGTSLTENDVLRLAADLIERAALARDQPVHIVAPSAAPLQFYGERSVVLDEKKTPTLFVKPISIEASPNDERLGSDVPQAQASLLTSFVCGAAGTVCGTALTILASNAFSDPLVLCLVTFATTFALTRTFIAIVDWMWPSVPAKDEIWGDGEAYENDLDADLTPAPPLARSEIPSDQNPAPQVNTSKDLDRAADEEEKRRRELDKLRGKLARADEIDIKYHTLGRFSQADMALNSERTRQLYQMVRHNIGEITTESGHRVCYMTGVAGYTWIIPAHILVPGQIFTFRRFLGAKGVKIEIDLNVIARCNIFISGTHDWATIELPDLGKVADLSKCWAPSLPDAPTVIRFAPMKYSDGTSHVFMSVSSRTKWFTDAPFNLGAQMMYNESGFCGIPIIDYRTGLLLGIHTAGIPSRRESYFACMTRSMLKIDPTVTSLQNGNLPELQALTCDAPEGTTPFGIVNPKYRNQLPKESTLRRAKGETGWPVTQYPARLNKFTVDGVEISPLKLAQSKYAKADDLKSIPKIDIDADLFPDLPRDHKFPGVTMHEAVFGAPAHNLKPLEPNASVGPHFKSMGKTRPTLIDFANKKLDPILINLVNLFRDGLLKGPIPVWVHDIMKDELRDEERVLLGKTRIIYVGDLVRLIMARMIFGPLVMHLDSNPVNSACAVGINATSVQWAALSSRLRLFDPTRKVWELDQENYDLKFGMPHQNYIADTLCPRLVDENVVLGRHYIESNVMQVHVVNGVAYVTWGKNLSGCFLTSTSGGTVSIGSIRGYAHTVGEKDLRFTTYSDDQLATVPENSKATPAGYQKYAKDVWGLTVTAVDKTPVVGWTEPEQAHFLARRFRKTNEAVYAPLDLDTIHSMLQYVRVKGGIDEEDTMHSRIASALLESIQHGKEVYNDVLRASRDVANAYRINVPLPTFECALESLRSKHYGS